MIFYIIKSQLIALLFLVPGQPKVVWLTPKEHDLGVLKKGVPATSVFKFRNAGREKLMIDNVRTTCSCTATEWPEEAILPGGEGAIKIEYDAAKPGHFNKKITVFFSNRKKAEKLFISGYVE